ncbi:hypothetical protein AgCh_026055 [Apium graveolens]
MAKKNPKITSSVNTDSVETLSNAIKWVPTNLLDSRDNNPCSMKKEKLEEARLLFYGKIEVVIPDADERVDWKWKLDYFFVNKASMGDDAAYLLDRWTSDEPHFKFDESNTSTKVIIEKVMALPVEDRLWPNCLNRPIRNSGTVDVEDFIIKMKKAKTTGVVERPIIDSAANMTRSKVTINTPLTKSSHSVQSLSSETLENPKDDKGIEMSSSRIYAKEFKPPVIKPLIISSRELFAKRAREEKSTETESSKTPFLLSPNISPDAKKLKTNVPASTSKYEAYAPFVTHGTLDVILDDVVGHTFHALQASHMAREVVENEYKKLKALEAAHSGCAQKLRTAQELATSNLKASMDVQKEFYEFAAKVQSLEAKMLLGRKHALIFTQVYAFASNIEYFLVHSLRDSD